MTAVTKKQIDTLVKVQQIEIETGKLKAYLDKVPARIRSLEQELETFIRSVEVDEAAIEEFNKQYRAFEADVQLNLTKIQKSQEKLHSVKTNKEYQSSLKEIDDIKSANSALEDEMLEILDSMPPALLETLQMNTAISQLMVWVNAATNSKTLPRESLAILKSNTSPPGERTPLSRVDTPPRIGAK